MTAGSIAVPTIVPLRQPTHGQHRTIVDTNTKIELHCETPGVAIFYTVNGSYPHPFQSAGNLDAKHTFRYKAPFCLPAGRTTIRAIAFSADVRESFVNTKVFDIVDAAAPEPRRDTNGIDLVIDPPAPERPPRETPKFSTEPLEKYMAWGSEHIIKGPKGTYSVLDLSRKAGRNDPNILRFMTNRKMDQYGNPTTDVGEVHYPVTTSGRIYSSSGSLDGMKQRWRHASGGVIRSHQSPHHSARSVGSARSVTCGQCHGSLSPEARFCHWCGAQPKTSSGGRQAMCTSCNASNSPHSAYCVRCGAAMVSAIKYGGVSGVSFDMSARSRSQSARPGSGRVVPRQAALTQSASRSSSSYSTHQRARSVSREDEGGRADERPSSGMGERSSSVMSLSPGRGYWRKQMEHVCGHLKAHAAHDEGFRSVIGEPRLGRLVSARVTEEGDEMCLSARFALRDGGDDSLGNTNNNNNNNSNSNNKKTSLRVREFLKSQSRGASRGLNAHSSIDRMRSAGKRNGARPSTAAAKRI